MMVAMRSLMLTGCEEGSLPSREEEPMTWPMWRPPP